MSVYRHLNARVSELAFFGRRESKLSSDLPLYRYTSAFSPALMKFSALWIFRVHIKAHHLSFTPSLKLK